MRGIDVDDVEQDPARRHEPRRAGGGDREGHHDVGCAGPNHVGEEREIERGIAVPVVERGVIFRPLPVVPVLDRAEPRVDADDLATGDAEFARQIRHVERRGALPCADLGHPGGPQLLEQQAEQRIGRGPALQVGRIGVGVETGIGIGLVDQRAQFRHGRFLRRAAGLAASGRPAAARAARSRRPGRARAGPVRRGRGRRSRG